jgi:lysozyme family protein
MADIKAAVEYVLRQEDSRLSGVITNDPGGRTRFGVAEKYHPELTSTGFYDTMPRDEALDMAIQVYSDSYAKPCKLNQIQGQSVGNALLSYAINMGNKQSIKLLQRTLGLDEDGVMGPKTLSSVNAVTPSNLLMAWKSMMISYYENVVEKHPEDIVYLNGWKNRVNQNTTQLV